RVAVAYADQRAVPGDIEADTVVRSGDRAALLVERFHLGNGDVFAGGVDRLAIGGETNRDGGARGFAPLAEDDLAVLRCARFDEAGLVFDLPLDVAQMRNVLAAQTLTIHEQLYFLRVRIDPDGNHVPFPAFEIPVRKQMERWLGSPPGFVVVESVLGETAHVHDPELRVDRRPAVGRRFAAIVKAGPGKAAGFPLTRAVELPPLLGGLTPGNHAVVIVDQVAQRVGRVHAARGDGAGGLRSIDRPGGIALVELVWEAEVVVEADNVQRVRHALPVISVDGGRNHAGGVKLFTQRHHGRADACPLLGHVALHLPFFIADPPENHR